MGGSSLGEYHDEAAAQGAKVDTKAMSSPTAPLVRLAFPLAIHRVGSPESRLIMNADERRIVYHHI
jgi:hypothetical protein